MPGHPGEALHKFFAMLQIKLIQDGIQFINHQHALVRHLSFNNRIPCTFRICNDCDTTLLGNEVTGIADACPRRARNEEIAIVGC